MKLSLYTLPASISLDADSDIPLYRQIYDGLREAILDARLKPGTRLPSTREAAVAFEVSRNTVMSAYEQLLAEGYVVGQTGSGTYVSPSLPEEMLHARSNVRRASRSSRRGRGPSHRGATIARTPSTISNSALGPRAFRPGAPAVDRFPFETWARLTAKHWRRPRRDLMHYGDPAGYGRLREAIAIYLGAARAVRCDAGQVIITSGAQQALELAARVTLDAGDPVWMEDPGYLGAKGAFIAAGARLVPVPLDAEGIAVDRGRALAPDARLVYVSPSHQYPSGVTMSLGRRLALLEWSERSRAWIVEDDYDSEFRYAGRPLASLHGLDCAGRVIYIGTFSKVLFPALRIGYVVVPHELFDAFISARSLADRHSPTIEQAVLADFIEGGHFERHIRRMRGLYAARQSALLEAASQELGGSLEISPSQAGMHLVGRLPEGVCDRDAALAAVERGVEVQPLSAFSLRSKTRAGLVLGYAAFDEREIRDGVRKLAAALRPLARGSKARS